MSQLDGVATVVALFDYYYCSRAGNRGDASLICPYFSFSFHYINRVKLISGRIIRQLIILPSLQSHPPCLLELPPPKRLTRIKPSISEGERKESMSFHAAHWTYSAKKARHFLWIIILNNQPACTMIFMLPDFLHWKIYV